MINYDKELNEQQCAVVKADPGPILVIAGAGSGKTRTLTYRVAYLMENGLPPDRLLLLTFTNKAAKEMLHRVNQLVPLDSSQIWGGTFHSIANRILRRHAKMIGYEPNFAIMDREDCKDLIQACIPDAGINPKEKRFPKPDVLIELFSLSVNTERKIRDMLDQQYSYFGEIAEPVFAVQKLYAERKRKANVMDYDDLLSNFVKLLKENPEIAELYGRQFLAILVDEYQDTNKIQSDMVDLIASRHKNIMVVGDDAQSIYSWRGANFKNIMEFPKRYEGAKVFKIEQNYRSTPQILGLANQSISTNTNQFQKNLQATRNDGIKPQVVPVLNASEQAVFVAQKMLELRDEGIPLNDMAVLYRSHFHAMELQMELTRRNIPFHITSGIRFFEQAHVKDVSAYLKLAINENDELAFKRIVMMMPKIGGVTAAKLWNRLQTENLKDGPSNQGSLLEQTKAPVNYLKIIKDVPKLAQDEWKQFAETMNQLKEKHISSHPDQMIRLVMDAGYEEYLQTKYENYLARREDLEQLAIFASKFKDTNEFLAELALMTNVEAEDSGPEMRDDEYVRLTTVHQAKGQEFRVVFVLWLTEGSFPHARCMDDPDQEEEERRLFYVAVTRAKDELYLIHPQLKMTGGYGEAFQSRSRFLDELPTKFYEKIEFDVGYA